MFLDEINIYICELWVKQIAAPPHIVGEPHSIIWRSEYYKNTSFPKQESILQHTAFGLKLQYQLFWVFRLPSTLWV